MTDKYYYLQDSRSYTGNDMMWWAHGGGYTSNLLDAEIFEKDKAVRQHESRETDIPWPKKYVDSKIRPAVDMQYCFIKEALKGTGIKLIKPKKISKPRYRGEICGRFVSEETYYSSCYHDNGCHGCVNNTWD